jgi:hypothetical protein
VARSNHNKTEKRSEKIIPCRHVDKDADADVVALIFNGEAMEKTIPPFPFTVAEEEEKEKIKLQYQETWHGETNPNDPIY